MGCYSCNGNSNVNEALGVCFRANSKTRGVLAHSSQLFPSITILTMKQKEKQCLKPAINARLQHDQKDSIAIARSIMIMMPRRRQASGYVSFPSCSRRAPGAPPGYAQGSGPGLLGIGFGI